MLYLLVNVAYLRALPMDRLAGIDTRRRRRPPRLSSGPRGGRLVTGLIVVSILGCLAATILYTSRLYVPMAETGSSSRPRGASTRQAHARRSLWLQGVWSALLAVTGGYRALYTWVTFAVVLFHVATCMALFVLRRTRPDAERPYRAWGYPVVPALFLLASLALTVATLFQNPVESGLGLIVVASGVPAWLWWRRRKGVGFRGA